MNYNPKVSIVVATYRRNQELKNALESIAKLTYESYEVIVVDDNDDLEWNHQVEIIISDFKLNYPKIQILYKKNHPNLGSAKTRNVGIESATGEYICFLDDDDLYLPERIQNQLMPMIAENADYSITDLILYSEHEKIVEIRKRSYIKDMSKDNLFKYHMMYHMTGTDTLMFKKAYLIKIGGFEPIDVGDEFYLMSKAIENGGKFIYVPVCDVKAYVHTGDTNLSSGDSKIQGENRLFEFKKKYFNAFEKEVIRYIRVRHYLVRAFAYLRKKQYIRFFKEIGIALLTDWKGVLTIVKNRK